ncbi:MAG: toll/interleukin-1 receptor domain-containing protein, partial [Methylococcaceae bacterium]|nr:toll/interleukin-1 receptor domain-containing protein [Methylococcaceae bacterium]
EGRNMASYNWKDYAGEDLWHRYENAPISRPARESLWQAKALAADYIGRANELAREYDRKPPDQLELALDLLLNARASAEGSPFAELFRGNPAFNGLVAQRQAANWGKRDSGAEATVVCPRLFISHRQADYPLALRIAQLAVNEGIEIWLDVIDPTLTWLNTVGNYHFTPRQEQLLIAVVIEMALLHSSHVMAVITGNTIGSGWVGYEYGRIKDSSLFSLQAGCWIHPLLGSTPWEYLLLGVSAHDENGIKRWLNDELREWVRRYRTLSCQDAARGDWRPEWGNPSSLPGS